MAASVVLYGAKHPGGPPVQWGAMCYDPVNDEIVLFPHAAVYNWDDWEKTGVVSGHLGTFVYSFKDNLWKRLRPESEPPPRCLSRMAYDQKNQCIVVFGGEHQDRLLNDTWVYDCKTRTWKELKPGIVPSPRAQHVMVYHPKSGRVLMTGGEGPEGIDRELWALDSASGQWQSLALAEPPWRTQFKKDRIWEKTRTGWPCYDWACAYDEANDLVVLRFNQACDTYVLRPDASKTAEAKGCAPYTEPPRNEIPPDDPQVLAKLKALPANTWVRAKPPREPADRGYTTISQDPATGWLYYIGGGHSTYTGDDVEVYQPGANRWVQSHRPKSTNSMHPFNKNCGFPAGVNFGGSWWTSHIHSYATQGGTVYSLWPMTCPYVYGPEKVRAWAGRYGVKPDTCLDPYYGCRAKPPELLFGYDWSTRQFKVRIPENEKGEWWGPQDTAAWGGLVITNGKNLLSMSRDRKRVGIYDPASNRFESKAIGGEAGPGGRIGEGHDNCLVPGREAVLVLGSSTKAKAKDKPCETWSYSIKDNSWTNLNAKNPPPFAEVGRLEYVPDQDVAYAIVDSRAKRSQWVYSFKHNAWKDVTVPLVTRFNGPMTQMVYSAKYGVFVMYACECTALMRPDFEKLDWGK